jgi:hypothetical protein
MASGYRAIVGDLDGDGLDDILWYDSGSDTDLGTTADHPEQAANVRGSDDPVAADTDGDGRDDIVFVNRSTDQPTTPVWTSGPSRTFVSRSHAPLRDSFLPPVQRATVPGGRDALPLWHLAPKEGPCAWRIRPDGSSGTEGTGADTIRPGAQADVLGHFSDAIREDVLVYDGFGRGSGNRLLLSPRATA